MPRETRSDDGWPLEFQRAGNHAEASVYRPSRPRRCAIFVCKSAKGVRARSLMMMNSNNRDYRRNFGRINEFLSRTLMTQLVTLELIRCVEMSQKATLQL